MDLTLAGAFATGLVTSVHCAGMCGPLACGVGASARSEHGQLAAICAYHTGRMTAYATIGAVCGALGKEPLGWFFHSPMVVLPWLLVLALLLSATRLDKKIPYPAALLRFTARMRFKAAAMPAITSGGLMGLLTPFLPCGPLYALFLALVTSGSAARGAETALAFSLGTIPLLWLAQRQWLRLKWRLGPQALARWQRGLALAAAVVLAWRLHGTLPLRNAEETPRELPSCCHEG
ncbi:sulfite exporter TauE/SafE family protein [Luteolibacter sp. LG18]|uniref:sulfite exporter TauE/SafE family protein n=1 Tax=Luteolibacter sp. LG18 TaxID=2819286 RepID=UPI002B30453B|nr:hypothetical protein llg_32330 [Luteolibacter sp. LG18]